MSSSTLYLHPNTQADLHNTIVAAGLRPVVVQTLGSAPESANTHGRIGTYKKMGVPIPYSGCIDFSVNQDATLINPVTFKDLGKAEMNETRIKWWLFKCGENHIAAFYRRVNQGFTARHIHGISVSVPLPPILIRQVVDWLTGRDGLKSHRREEYWMPPESTEAKLKERFLLFNPVAKDLF